jgi:hypothetical protein
MATTLQEILERYEHEHASTHAVIAAMPDAFGITCSSAPGRAARSTVSRGPSSS